MANASVGSIRLFVLGDARIETPKGEIEPTAEIVFAAALYLILERREPVSRKQLTEILWPGVEPSLASHRMRQTLLKLRQVGFPIHAEGHGRLILTTDQVAIDYEDLVPNSGRLDPQQLERLNLLPGYEPRFSPHFLDWLDSWKRRINSVLSSLAIEVIAGLRAEARWQELERAASNLLRLSPYNETATLALAEAL